MTATEQDFFHETGQPGWYRHGVALGAKSWEMGSALAPAGAIFTVAEVKTALAFGEVGFDAPLGPSEKRLLSERRERYWSDDLTGPLGFGQVESLALPYESYAKALTPTMLSSTIEGKLDAGTVTTEGGYEDLDADGCYWAGSGTQSYDAGAFYLVTAVTDVFGNTTDIE